jgi:hypothetical protein
VNELGHLVSLLPLANYSLLRTLCSHLIKVIELSDVNKMTMRNVGIVFSPTLGIPGGVFALFLTEFDWIFFTDAMGEPAPKQMEEDILPPDASELEGHGGFPTSSVEQTQDNTDLQESQDHFDSQQYGQARVVGAGGKANNRNSWIAGNALHSGDGKTTMNLNRDNRNSLCYNESEADKLLGGPQSRYRLSLHHEEVEAMMKSTLDDIQDSIEGLKNSYEVNDLQVPSSSMDGHMPSPSLPSIAIQPSPRITSRKLPNYNALNVTKNVSTNDGPN